ncbi:putative RTA1 like protein [Lyophyllum shimeji]|uniref:RTA1 like protein n=1 Tax=Lyophyllum shimeji TaxID=47721 RepID=A0A9P3UI32_LYOSH|nr:putative RTA1 like protein [Lyophyllum shimeji]
MTSTGRLKLVSAFGFACHVCLVSSVVAIRKGDLPHPADPFADPKHDPYNPLKYIASNALTATSFTLILLVGIFQTLCVRKYGARWMLPMVVGAYTFAFRLGVRFALHVHPESQGWYITEYLFVVLSPCAFIAADYVLLGRIASHLDSARFLLLPARRITAVFVSSDITTFLIQAIGGALSVSANAPARALAGSHIFLAGLTIQLFSFFLFTCVYLLFLYRLYRHTPLTWAKDRGEPWYKDWRTLAFALIISCIGILIRSGFRVVELSEGFQGRLATSEAFFYGLDTLPLFIATSIYIPFWPGRFMLESSSLENEFIISGGWINPRTIFMPPIKCRRVQLPNAAIAWRLILIDLGMFARPPR